MIDAILPNDLDKLIRLFESKYVKEKAIKELAGIKCLVDFRIKLYSNEVLGEHSKCKKYIKAGLYLHKCLTNELVPQLNDQINLWCSNLYSRAVV